MEYAQKVYYALKVLNSLKVYYAVHYKVHFAIKGHFARKVHSALKMHDATSLLKIEARVCDFCSKLSLTVQGFVGRFLPSKIPPWSRLLLENIIFAKLS